MLFLKMRAWYNLSEGRKSRKREMFRKVDFLSGARQMFSQDFKLTIFVDKKTIEFVFVKNHFDLF